MALLHVNFYSRTLERETQMDVILPEAAKKLIGMEGVATRQCKTLYLLHGMSDDQTVWQRRTSIERYAQKHNLAVIMPEVQRSFYCDMTNGPRYFTYIVDELPALCQRLFRVSARREDNFVAGLSMGGYGAMKAALSRPERYAAAASFSGAVDVAARLDSHPDIFQATCGGTLRAEDDLFRLAEKTAGERPRLYISCGTEDFLLESIILLIMQQRSRINPQNLRVLVGWPVFCF